MRSVEEICERFFKSEEELERDLMLYLKYKETGSNYPQHIRGIYLDAIVWILEKCECLNDLAWKREINDKGREFIKRGWVLRDYTTPRIKEYWKTIREWSALLIAIVFGFLGCFFPIKETDKTVPELMELRVETINIIPQNLDSIPQIKETCKNADNQDTDKN